MDSSFIIYAGVPLPLTNDEDVYERPKQPTQHRRLNMKSSYIYNLPSNRSADIYPDNTLSSYSTALRRPLDDEYRTEFFEIFSRVARWRMARSGRRYSRRYSTRHILLLERIHVAGRHVDGRLGTVAHYNANMRKVLISPEGKSAITLDHGLALVFGIDEARALEDPGQFTPSRRIDLNHGVHAMYVH